MLSRPITYYAQNSLLYLASSHWRAMLKKMTLRQFLQVIYVIAEWKSRRTVCQSRPFVFRIEPSAICNLKCLLCSTTYHTGNHIRPRIMSVGLFSAIHDKIKSYAWRMTFYLRGEPMMNPHLFEMIELSTRMGHVFASFSTNFTLMREQLLLPLFNSRLDWLSVSVDGYRQETYERYRVNGKVRDVLNGIAMIMAFRRQGKFIKPYVQVNMINFSHIPSDEVNELKEFCADCGVDMFRVRPDETGLLGPYVPVITRKPASKCHWPWTSMSIDVDGSVFVCPIALEQGICYGNLAMMSLDEVWNNELYTSTREYLSRKGDDREGLPRLPCYNCRWYGKSEPETDELAVRKQWLLSSNAAVGFQRAEIDVRNVGGTED